jgi:hypothetical protein
MDKLTVREKMHDHSQCCCVCRSSGCCNRKGSTQFSDEPLEAAHPPPFNCLDLSKMDQLVKLDIDSEDMSLDDDNELDDADQ